MSRRPLPEPDVDQPDNDDLADQKPSKSALKRQMHALQALGERLLKLRPNELKKLPLSDRLREELTIYHQIRPARAKAGAARCS